MKDDKLILISQAAFILGIVLTMLAMIAKVTL